MAETFDLTQPEGILAAASYVQKHPVDEEKNWRAELTSFFEWLDTTKDLATRSTLDFHRRLWQSDAISGVGMGTISVEPVIASDAFRRWLAEESLKSRPESRKERLAEMEALYREMMAHFEAANSRIPHLKIFRVLAAFFPDDFTTIADRGTLEALIRRMRGTGSQAYVANHFYVRDRLDEVLGLPGPSRDERLRRLELGWYLYYVTNQSSPGEKVVVKQMGKPGVEKLIPLPAESRRRGLTALAGSFKAMLAILHELKDGLSRDEFLDYLTAQYPNLKENSRRMVINILRSELGVIRKVDDDYVLTESGRAVLETASAQEMGSWLLTQILGVDHVLKRVSQSPATKLELVQLLQQVNPGWSSDFAPTAMINWLLSMEAIAKDKSGLLALAEIGRDWNARITWEPEKLLLSETDDIEDEAVSMRKSGSVKLVLPPLDKVVQYVTSKGQFSASLVEQLHLGLWSRSHRHLAVLAGISGSGKSLLGLRYAEALGANPEHGLRRLHFQPVQPGWYDPTPLLGYRNPLQKDSYQRTAFLSFLLRASADPGNPYVVILDEMNLSHPEQYFAPFLSAMETKDGGVIHLHAEGDEFDGLPPWIPYPANLAIIGTVNMDETTHGLSDKVLDRAFTLEFWEIDLAQFPNWNGSGLDEQQAKRVREVLEGLMKALAPGRLHFGWRVVEDVVEFLATGVKMSATTSFESLLDAVIYAKVLPKLRGEDSDRLTKALADTTVVLDSFGLKRSHARVVELRDELARAGSARFWR